MEISKKQLIDIISSSISAAIGDEEHLLYPSSINNISNIQLTPYEIELRNILNWDNADNLEEIKDFTTTAVNHITAIRLGMKIERESGE